MTPDAIIKASVCPLDCPDTCNLAVTVVHDEVVQVRGDQTSIWSCDGSFIPLRVSESGRQLPFTWQTFHATVSPLYVGLRHPPGSADSIQNRRFVPEGDIAPSLFTIDSIHQFDFDIGLIQHTWLPST